MNWVPVVSVSLSSIIASINGFSALAVCNIHYDPSERLAWVGVVGYHHRFVFSSDGYY